MKKLVIVTLTVLLAGNPLFAVKPYFVPNKGQVKNDIAGYARSGNANVFFSPNSVTFQFFKKQPQPKRSFSNEQEQPISVDVLNLQVDFEESNVTSQIHFEKTTGAKENYFIGNDPNSWVTNLEVYERLRCTSLYENIDMLYYFNENGLEYDLLLKPGAEISSVKMRIKGAHSLALSPDGKLLIGTSLGTLTESIPESYQIVNGKKVQRIVKFVILEKDLVGFECVSYSPELPLVIDPVLGFSTFIGGSGNDEYNMDMGMDNSGNTYVCGEVNSVNFPTQAGSYHLTYYGGITDGVVMKLSNNGSTLMYCTYLGATGFDGVNAVYVNKTTGEVTMCGFTEGPTFPTTVGAIQSVVNGSRDNFIAKLNATGSTLVFSTLLGGFADDRPFDITVDNLSNIYIIGYGGAGFPFPPGCYQSAYYGNYDVYAYKLNPNATALLHGTYIGGTVYDRPSSIAVDSEHSVYITGTVDWAPGGGFPVTTGAYNVTHNGNVDIFVAKFDSTLSNLDYSTYVGGPGADWTLGPSALEVNAGGEAIVVGYVQNGFPTTSGCFDNTFNGGNTDGALFKLSASGSSLLFSTYMGSSGDDRTMAVQLDASGNIWCAGQAGFDYPTTSCALDITYNGGSYDGFVSQFDFAGAQLLSSTFIGGSQDDKIYNLLVNNNFFQVSGTTGSGNYPVTNGAYDVSHNGGSDYFVTQVLNSGVPITISGPTIACIGQQVVLTAAGAVSYTWNTGATTSNIAFTYTLPGVYSVTAVDASGCYGTQSFTIMNGGSVPSMPNAITGPTAACGTGNLQYSVNAVAGATSYSWALPGGWTGISSSNTISTGSNLGAATLSVVAQNTCGSSPVQTIAVTVSTINLNLTALPGGTVCQGTNLQLIASGATNYTWSTGSNAATITPGPASPPFSVYQVNGVNGICSASASTTITVLPLPTLTVSTLKKTICKNETATLTVSGAQSYSWSTGATQATITPVMATSNTFVVTGSDKNGCTNTVSVVQLVSICEGIEEGAFTAGFRCYPNPVDHLLNIVCEHTSLLPAKLELLDAESRLVRSEKLVVERSVLDLSDLPAGIYFLRVLNEGKTVHQEKFIKQ